MATCFCDLFVLAFRESYCLFVCNRCHGNEEANNVIDSNSKGGPILYADLIQFAVRVLDASETNLIGYLGVQMPDPEGRVPWEDKSKCEGNERRISKVSAWSLSR
ncbi:hypothetical protein H5410_024144 [Solanum commersonii]|uniref:Uncharacterized protein n=1 Tax=Solanum commersonii TaxID=4109 RepID=A0A9J5ZL55_SOLCO|nr:hypothetical protein H5410_024144 [Solanum commersonii]